MSQRRVAVSRAIAASRDATPSNSVCNSRYPSREASPANSRPSSRHTSRERLASSPVNSRPSSRHPSRERLTSSPANSRPSSRRSSRERLTSEILTNDSEPLDNEIVIDRRNEEVMDNRNSNHLSPPQKDRNEGRRGWSGSSSNLTSTDSTPSSDHTTDSGQATDSSPLAGGPLAALGFPQSSETNNTCLYRMPIVGYEVLEERSRYTVFKIQVLYQPTGDQWFVFRRYTDFVRLNKRLRSEFPGLRFALPPKRWFGDNFDPIFLEDRQLGLQAFIDSIIGHIRIREKKCVRDFFCLDDPPGPHDSLEESRAMCLCLEENIADLQEQLREKDGEISVLRSHINFLMAQQQTLVKALRLECELQSKEGYNPGSTHDLNLALLSICERTLEGGLHNTITNFGARNGETPQSGDDSPVRKLRKVKPDSTVTSPLQRTLERVFLPHTVSQPALSPSAQTAEVISSGRTAQGPYGC